MRVSERMRERAAARLSRGRAEGYLSADTLSVRLAAAFSARNDVDLDRLTGDIPRLPAPLIDAGRAIRRAARQAREWVLGAPALPHLTPPRLPHEGDRMLIGRAGWCNLVIDRSTVSRRHAELRRHAGGWLLTDLESTNGTWVNGWRVEQVFLRPGDQISFGEFSATFG